MTKSALTTLLETGERLREKATPGPFTARVNEFSNHALPKFLWGEPHGFIAEFMFGKDFCVPNAEYAAYAMNSLRARDEIIKCMFTSLANIRDGEVRSPSEEAKACSEAIERIAEEAIK